MRGVRTHGLIRLPTYVDKLASGEYNPTPRMRWSRRPGVIHLDADDAMGQIAAARAIDAACEMAAAQPSVLCFGTRLGHLGAVGGFALRAARRGFFAVVMQRTPPMMGLPGYRGPVIGNSPLAFASPVPGSAPISVQAVAPAACCQRISDSSRRVTTQALPRLSLRTGEATLPAISGLLGCQLIPSS